MKNLIVVVALLTSTGVAIAQPVITGPGVTTSPLYVDNTKLWTNPSIAVCWEKSAPSSTYATERGWVQSAANNSWPVHSKVAFTGWGDCPSGSFHGIRIGEGEVQPHTVALGRDLDGTASGMMLNFTFASWSPACASDKQYCIQAIAVHEFGHALGFAHEQNRPDAQNFLCKGSNDQPSGGNGTVYVGPWDLDSVMNYCNPQWNGSGRLSAIDIEGVQRFYGAPPNYAFCNFQTGPFEWNCSGAPAGATCAAISEPADPDTWADNYFCWHKAPGGVEGSWPDPAGCGFKWSSAGVIAGKKCVQISEAAEPASHTWGDNFLCMSPACPYSFTWSSAGRLPNLECMPWREPADPDTWNDNYLCWDTRPPEAQPKIVAAVERKDNGGAFGLRENRLLGGRCPDGFQRDSCQTMQQVDSVGWCASSGTGMNSHNQNETLGFVSGDPNDCTCRYHEGAAIWQPVHCTVQVAAVCAPGRTRCGDNCVDTSSDSANCGACGSACAAGTACSGAHCVAVGPPDCERTAGPFTWSCYRQVPGQSCIQILEAADPDTWNDNYLCTTGANELKWSSAGAIPGMACTAVREDAEPPDHTWNDNFICAPPNSSRVYSWSMAGPLPGQQCVQWLEPSDPHTWSDNYLCFKPKPHGVCPPGEIKCPNGTCVSEEIGCSSVCHPPLQRCLNGQCLRFCPEH